MRLVLLLSLLNLFNYVDRFIMASSLSRIRSEMALTDFEAGSLMSAFVLPYTLSAIFLALWADRGRRVTVLRLGAVVWSISTVLTAFAQNYGQLFFARGLLGIGEAAFSAVAPGLLISLAETGNRGRTMAIFSAALPLGLAFGYVGGGVLTEHFGWRTTYWAMGAPALLLTAWLFLEKHMGRNDVYAATHAGLAETFKGFFANRVYLACAFGYAAYLFVAGGVSHWMPTFIEQTWSLTPSQSNGIFGGAAIAAGLFGNFVGGYLGDRWDKARPGGHLRLCAASMFFSLIPFVMTFYASSLTMLIVWTCVTQFFFFLSTSPLNVAVLNSIDRSRASLATALVMFISHVFGDALSSPVIGHVSDLSGSLKTGMLAVTPFILVAGILWGLPVWKSRAQALS